MQNIYMNLRVDGVAASPLDEYLQPTTNIPAITREMRAMLVLRLFDPECIAFVESDLQYATWDFVLAHDWITETPVQVRVADGITVVGNEVRIPLTELNSQELITLLGNNASIQLGAELAGFSANEEAPSFLVQFNINVRNRRGTRNPLLGG